MDSMNGSDVWNIRPDSDVSDHRGNLVTLTSAEDVNLDEIIPRYEKSSLC